MKSRYRSMLRKMREKEGEPAPKGTGEAVWSVYILRCCDGSFYTGVTTDLERRLREHQEGKAARYTRTRRPIALAYREECGSRSESLARECAVKSLSRLRKQELISGKPVDPRKL